MNNQISSNEFKKGKLIAVAKNGATKEIGIIHSQFMFDGLVAKGKEIVQDVIYGSNIIMVEKA